MSDSLWPHGLQHTRLPCPSSPGACSNSCPLSPWCHPTVTSSIIPFAASSIRVFSSELALFIRWPNYWSFSLSISPSNEYSGLISFRIDWFDLLAVQETLMSLLQNHNSKASILWCSASFMIQLSHPYMTSRKAIALTVWSFVGKVMSLLFNTLSRFVIAFLHKEQASFNFLAITTILSDLYIPTKVKSVSWLRTSAYQIVLVTGTGSEMDT